ncbi:branched-chain amino acid ABC transporter permease [Brevibacterium sp. LS14]|nr:branched-chain amino acid ABC transporter permease [Brevibacterium sp. LS14]
MVNMSSSFRTIERILPSSTYRAVAIITVTIVAVALSYGAISQVSGFAWWQTLMLAAFALGGAAEFTFVGVIAAGGAPILAVLAGLLVNSRNFAFGMAVGPFFPQDWRALIAAHWINDESTAVARTGGGTTASGGGRSSSWEWRSRSCGPRVRSLGSGSAASSTPTCSVSTRRSRSSSSASSAAICGTVRRSASHSPASSSQSASRRSSRSTSGP